jgi:hypothetical protein
MKRRTRRRTNSPKRIHVCIMSIFVHPNRMPSLIFVTLKDGEYNDYWSSDLNTLLADDHSAGYREMHWCGQRKKTTRDHLVCPGTLVAIRKDKKSSDFTIVGTVSQRDCITPKVGRQPATYTLLVEVWKSPRVIPRAADHRCVHWSVLRTVGIPYNGAYMPEGIYST